ncbi:MAG: VOC family protein [Pseudomonadota bacterium]
MVNALEFRHLAFGVGDIEIACEATLRAGGSMQRQISDLETEEDPIVVVYVRDPEGNVVELEQA